MSEIVGSSMRFGWPAAVKYAAQFMRENDSCLTPRAAEGQMWALHLYGGTTTKQRGPPPHETRVELRTVERAEGRRVKSNYLVAGPLTGTPARN